MGKKKNKAKKLKVALAAQANTQVASQTATPAALQTIAPVAAQGFAKAIQTAPHIYLIPNNYNPSIPTMICQPNRPIRKWQKLHQKMEHKSKIRNIKQIGIGPHQPEENFTEDPQFPETSRDGSPSIIGETKESPTSVATGGSSQGSMAKPSFTLKTKKSLQEDMMKQRLTWIKPAENDPGAGPSTAQGAPQMVQAPQAPSSSRPLPGSSAGPSTPQNAPQLVQAPQTLSSAGPLPGSSAGPSMPQGAPQMVQAPQAPSSAGPLPGSSAGSSLPQEAPKMVQAPQTTPSALLGGSTIPILENRTMESKPRSNAGSFFKKAAPTPSWVTPAVNVTAQQPSHSPRLPTTNEVVGMLRFKYPKGIPRSFLLQQEKSLEAVGAPMTADSPIWPSNPQANPAYPHPTILGQQPPDHNMELSTLPTLVQTEDPDDIQQPYSPSDIYSELANIPEPPELDTESSDQNQSGQKRLSAFHRLGPVSQPKKPKLTINLNLKKDQPVREVVDETDNDPDKYTPVHLRQDIMTSTDETVTQFLPCWPWRKNVTIRRSATARNSRSVMILEQEKMEESYEKENIFIQISVKGYPSTWVKEQVLDAVLDNVKGYSLIPCFTEFSKHECKFLVLRSRSALIVLHKTGFYIHKDGVELTVTISLPVLPDKLNFIPRIVVRKRIVMGYKDRKMNFSAFTLQNDISHFIYFPLNRVTNQRDCIQMQTSIDWNRLVDLDLSHNKLTTISGFDLINMTPSLKHLNLSYNCLEKITVLLSDRLLPLKTIKLEGNPLCHDYIDPEHYIKVIKMMFPAVEEIDGVPIHRKGELPGHKQNYCPEETQEVAEKFLEIFFRLLDSGSEQKLSLQAMYDDDAILTVTYCYKLRYSQLYKNFRNLFLYARFLDEGDTDSVVGAMAITKLINRWPDMKHDPSTFTVDTVYHSEKTTILRISGILKLTAQTLAEDEHLLSFTRTVVLYTEDGTEYKIQNEMVYWSEPSAEAARSAFTLNTIYQKNFELKIEATTDEDLRDKFLKIFMKLTSMDKKICERCLEINDWNFTLALEHFIKLLKLNNFDSLTQDPETDS